MARSTDEVAGAQASAGVSPDASAERKRISLPKAIDPIRFDAAVFDLDGVVTFLAARGIILPEGQAGEAPDALTVRALGARKDADFLQRLARSGVTVFPDARPLLENLRAAGLKTALVSSSRNAKAVLAAGGLTALIDVVVDGVEAARLGLTGKPSPDTFLRAVRQLGVSAARAVGQAALAVLRGAHCPVVLLDPARTPEGWSLGRVLALHDGSPTISNALGPATALARAAGAELVVLQVAQDARILEGRWEDASILQAVARGAPCPVMVTRVSDS